MTKIFLFMEDSAELAGFEILLRKLGFDAVSATREAQVAERMLGFYPDLAILPGKSKGFDGLKLAGKLRKLGFQGPIALTWAGAGAPTDSDLARARVGGLISYPIDPPPALRIIAELVGQDPDALLLKFERLQKSRGAARDSDLMIVRSGAAAGGKPQPADGTSTLANSGSGNAKRAAGAAMGGDDDLIRVSGAVDSGRSTSIAGGAVRNEPPRPFAAGETEESTVASSRTGRTAEAETGGRVSSIGDGGLRGRRAQDGVSEAAARAGRNARMLAAIESEDTAGVLPKGMMAIATDELRKASLGEKEELDRLHESKKEFVRALFNSANAARKRA